MKSRVLWIDDGAIADLVELTGPVYASGRYSLDIATNISDAVDKIQRREYDVVIVDIRLPPGERKEWVQLYQAGGQNPTSAQLGLLLLDSCLHPRPKVPLSPRPTWLSPQRFGVFTVEGNLKGWVEALGIKVYHVKEVDPSRRKLVEVIEEVRSAS